MVSRDTIKELSRAQVPVSYQEISKLDTGWTVEFQPERGAHKKLHFDKLIPLNEHDIAGVRYFSGITRYSNTFNRPKNEDGGKQWCFTLRSSMR